MSISTVAGPAFNKFYDQTSVSDGQSADSFIVGPPAREKKEKQKHAGTDEGLLASFLKPFSHCCAPFRRTPATGSEPVFATGASGDYVDDSGMGLGGFALQGSEITGSDSSSSSGGTFADIPRGAKVQMLAERPGKGTLKRTVPEFERIATWKVALPESFSAEIELSVPQRQFAIVTWCVRMEQSEQMTDRLLRLLLKAAASEGEDVDVAKKMKTSDEFAVLELLRLVEARLIQEILGDLFKCIEETQGTGGIYLLLTKDEDCMGVYARTQGEAVFLSVFDPSGAPWRGAGFFGFSKAEEVGEFISGTFKAAVERRKPTTTSGSRFQAMLIKSKHVYLPTAELQRKEWEKAPDPPKANVWEAGKHVDPRHEAKVVYSAMYQATTKPAAKERVFSRAPQAGMHIQTQGEVNREANSQQ